MRQFVRPAALLPASASAGQVRALLTGSPDVSGVLLVDRDGVPVRSVHRSRFLLTMSGRYGHALYADRPAAKLGDVPRTVGVDATAWEVLDVVAVGGRAAPRTMSRWSTPTDGAWASYGSRTWCGALAESRVEEAAGLNPLTRLPGSDAITAEVDRRIADGRAFALSWLDVDHFKQVNDRAGFAAGDELIRAVGRVLSRAASGSTRGAHRGATTSWCSPTRRRWRGSRPACWTCPGRRGAARDAVPGHGPVSARRCAGPPAGGGLPAPLKEAAKALRGASWVLGGRGHRGTSGACAGLEPGGGADGVRAGGPADGWSRRRPAGLRNRCGRPP
ncbi:diguanylate cyclase [Streptomyces sp. SS52]|nr:diguanylate cyclase [Streptomyces sp. SS52]